MITAPNIMAAGGASETVTVVYSDPNSAINTSTIASSNLTVTTPGDTLAYMNRPRQVMLQLTVRPEL